MVSGFAYDIALGLPGSHTSSGGALLIFLKVNFVRVDPSLVHFGLSAEMWLQTTGLEPPIITNHYHISQSKQYC